MYQITRRELLSENTFLWEVFAPDVALAAKAGQFVMVRLREGGERIPLTVADYDRRRGTITMVVQAIGKTTRQMLAYQAGEWFQDFVGPLGVATHIQPAGHTVLVGGGLGVAPVFPQLRAYQQAGSRTTSIIGFRTKELVFWEDRFRQHSDELIVCTDDGTYGRAGFVTAALQELCAGPNPPDRVVAIGPMGMMAACAEVTRPFGIETMVSLNTIMVDGTGMCGSCRVSVAGEIRFACVDGPDFDGHKVDFPELLKRQGRFKSLETTASEDHAHVCNLTKELVVDGRRNYKKLKNIAPHATPMPERNAAIRATNFEEVNLGYTWDQALAEAERCLQCKNPSCVSGCPVQIDIPGFIRNLLVRDLDGALATIHQSNLFPSVCGRVCPQESQCESQCILVKRMDSVAIGRLERFVGDHAPLQAAPQLPIRKDGARAAIVGSGPAGLACAGDLARAGVEVVVFEALHVVGGVLQYGIPSFRLPRDTIAREIESLERLGVRFEVNKVIGQTHTVAQLLEEQGFSSVFVATGAGYPKFLGIDGESAGQVYSANEFLTRVNLMGGDHFPYEDTPVSRAQQVVVIGAGNTAMDCTRVARRIGAKAVHCVYRRSEAEAPARIEELRHAREEGVDFHFLRSPLAIHTDEQGDVTGLLTQVMELGEPDASGRRSPVAVDGQTELVPCDAVIYALGTQANPIVPRATPGLGLNKWKYIEADPVTQATNLPGVFAGGDIVTGGATVILALGSGRRAAAGMLDWLERGAWPPSIPDASATPEVAGATCPKCHRPVEDDAYVCCADQLLHWRCESCDKRYEGFAFPYGLCPSCGGSLSLHESSPAEPADRKVVRQALEIELGGIALYERGRLSAADPELRELFGQLADMERGHVSLLCERYHVTPPGDELMTPTTAQLAIYAGLEETPRSGEELLELALELEIRGRDFFSAQAVALPDGSPVWRLVRELQAEEYEHVVRVETALEAWREGRRFGL